MFLQYFHTNCLDDPETELVETNKNAFFPAIVDYCGDYMLLPSFKNHLLADHTEFSYRWIYNHRAVSSIFQGFKSHWYQ